MSKRLIARSLKEKTKERKLLFLPSDRRHLLIYSFIGEEEPFVLFFYCHMF